MHISLGDLVSCPRQGLDRGIGVVIEKNHANLGLDRSEHTRRTIGMYPDVYYVLTFDEGKLGPYNVSELSLIQSGPSSIAANIER